MGLLPELIKPHRLWKATDVIRVQKWVRKSKKLGTDRNVGGDGECQNELERSDRASKCNHPSFSRWLFFFSRSSSNAALVISNPEQQTHHLCHSVAFYSSYLEVVFYWKLYCSPDTNCYSSRRIKACGTVTETKNNWMANCKENTWISANFEVGKGKLHSLLKKLHCVLKSNIHVLHC